MYVVLKHRSISIVPCGSVYDLFMHTRQYQQTSISINTHTPVDPSSIIIHTFPIPVYSYSVKDYNCICYQDKQAHLYKQYILSFQVWSLENLLPGLVLPTIKQPGMCCLFSLAHVGNHQKLTFKVQIFANQAAHFLDGFTVTLETFSECEKENNKNLSWKDINQRTLPGTIILFPIGGQSNGTRQFSSFPPPQLLHVTIEI